MPGAIQMNKKGHISDMKQKKHIPFRNGLDLKTNKEFPKLWEYRKRN